MSPRAPRLVLVLTLALGAALAACGGGGGKEVRGPDGKEPQTAKEKQLLEARESGELDGPQAKWGKWRYTGDRNNCNFVIGKQCFKTKAKACKALRCKAPAKCKADGAGPATMTCEKK